MRIDIRYQNSCMVLKHSSVKPRAKLRRALSMTSSLQEHKQFCGKEAHYEAWTNHNACLTHREWWRDVRLVSAFLILTGVAIGASASAYFCNHDDVQIGSTMVGYDFLPKVGKEFFFPTNNENDQKIVLWNKLRNQGLQQISAGDLKSGISTLKKAEALTGIKPAAHADLLNDIAVAEHKAGNSVESIIYFNEAVKLDPSMRAAQKNLTLAKRLESIDTWE